MRFIPDGFFDLARWKTIILAKLRDRVPRLMPLEQDVGRHPSVGDRGAPEVDPRIKDNQTWRRFRWVAGEGMQSGRQAVLQSDTLKAERQPLAQHGQSFIIEPREWRNGSLKPFFDGSHLEQIGSVPVVFETPPDATAEILPPVHRPFASFSQLHQGLYRSSTHKYVREPTEGKPLLLAVMMRKDEDIVLSEWMREPPGKTVEKPFWRRPVTEPTREREHAPDWQMEVAGHVQWGIKWRFRRALCRDRIACGR